jgi:hypothetical protein
VMILKLENVLQLKSVLHAKSGWRIIFAKVEFQVQRN